MSFQTLPCTSTPDDQLKCGRIQIISKNSTLRTRPQDQLLHSLQSQYTGPQSHQGHSWYRVIRATELPEPRSGTKSPVAQSHRVTRATMIQAHQGHQWHRATVVQSHQGHEWHRHSGTESQWYRVIRATELPEPHSGTESQWYRVTVVQGHQGHRATRATQWHRVTVVQGHQAGPPVAQSHRVTRAKVVQGHQWHRGHQGYQWHRGHQGYQWHRATVILI